MDCSELSIQLHSSIQKNLGEIEREATQNATLRLCELSCVADTLCSYMLSLIQMDIPTTDALLAMRDALLQVLSAWSAPACQEEYPSVHYTLESIHALDRALLVDLLIRKLSEAGVSLREGDFVGEGDDVPLYAYVKNTLADEAFEIFSENTPDARVRYASSFLQAATMLARGEVGFSLFPIEEGGGLRLPTVERLLYSSDLRIRRITPVFGLDGQADLKYALVARTVSIEPYQKEDDRYLELRIRSHGDGPSLPAILLAIELYGLTLYRIHTVSFEREGEGKDYISLVVRSQGVDFSRLLAYLTLYTDSYTLVGIYKNLEG